MITIDNLIEEGNRFEVKIRSGYTAREGVGKVIAPSTEYIENEGKYFLWQETCKRYIATYYPNDRAIEDFENASKIISKKNYYKQISILVALREIPEPCVKNTQNNKGGTIITVNQNQLQNQNLEVCMVEVIKDCLTVDQFQDLQKIVKENPQKEDTKPKIIEKLKSFGSDVLSNIIADIITRSTNWLGLF